MTDTNIKMVRGDTLAFGLEFEYLSQDLDACYFSCKTSYSATDYVFQKSLGDGISKVEDGQYRVRVAPEDTANVTAGHYYYDLQIEVNSDVYTLMKGALEIEADVTRG